MRLRTLIPVLMLGGLAAAGAPNFAAAQSWSTRSLSRRSLGEDLLEVNVKFASGALRLRAGSPTSLYRAELRYDADHFEPTAAYDAGSGTLRLGVEGDSDRDGWEMSQESGQYLDVELSPLVPLSLHVEFGMAVGMIDLGGLSLSRAEIASGASETVVAFSEPNRIRCERLEVAVGAAELIVRELGNARCASIEIAGGAGKMTVDLTGEWDAGLDTQIKLTVGVATLTLRVPENLGVAVELTRLFAGFESSGFTKRGDRYFSNNYDTAETKVALAITAALGDVDVVWLEPDR